MTSHVAHPYREPAFPLPELDVCEGTRLSWWRRRKLPRRVTYRLATPHDYERVVLYACPSCGADVEFDQETKALRSHPRRWLCANPHCKGPLAARLIQKARQECHRHCAYGKRSCAHMEVWRGVADKYRDALSPVEKRILDILENTDPPPTRSFAFGGPDSDWICDNHGRWYCCRECSHEHWALSLADCVPPIVLPAVLAAERKP